MQLIYVAWWTGKGYQTIWIVLASAVLFQLGRAAFSVPDGAWVFGISLIGAAIANWIRGRKINSKSLAKVRKCDLRQRLLYQARHKFMSLPMETFSFLLAIAGVAIIGCSIAGII